MRWFRTLVILIVAGSAIVIAGAIGQQPASRPAPAGANTPAPPPAPSAKPDAEGTRLLAEAIKQLNPKKLAWVQTTFWEQADVQGLTFQAQGSYVSAPDHRLHMDLNVQMGEAPGKLEIVSDGKNLWEAMQIGQQPRVVTKKVELAKVLDTLKGNVEAEQVREEFFQNQSFTGVVPLLQSIQKRMIVTGHEKTTLGGREVVRLTAAWIPEIAKAISTPDKPWPAYLARQCVLYFEPIGKENILWPRRLEWWGPAPPRQGESILLQIEFRDPKLNQPLSDERCAREFKFDVGSGEIPDRTAQEVEKVKARAEQLVKQKKSR
jgi:hypothetical protein